jgi:sortase A
LSRHAWLAEPSRPTDPDTVTTPPIPEAHELPPAALPAAAGRERRRRSGLTARLVRIAGTALVVAGIGAVAWTIVVWRWQDPFTALYTMYQQHKLSGRYHKIADAYQPLLIKESKAVHARKAEPSAVLIKDERDAVKRDAKRYQGTLHAGTPLGRIKVHRLGLNAVLVTGTDHDSLTKGPGWDTRTFLPGAGKLIYIAGHRTTYLAPFARINKMKPGDLVTIEVPYGAFVYRVRSHVIVPADDLSRLRSSNRPAGTPAGEVVALQACHPRFFATQRYIVYAVLARVVPKGGKAYTVS